MKNKFTVGKSYLMEHKHKAFGGGMWVAECTHIIGDRVCLNGKWHNANTYLETREIISEVNKEEVTK